MDNKKVEFTKDTVDVDHVEVKESSKTYNVDELCFSRGITIHKLKTENHNLKNELEKAGVDLESSQRTFEAVTSELKKQLDVAKKRESEVNSKTMRLHLENEKLHILLESKQNLVDKLKKEMLNLKNALKVTIKGICTESRESYFDGGDEGPRPQSARSPCEHRTRSPRVRFADSLDVKSDDPLEGRHET